MLPQRDFAFCAGLGETEVGQAVQKTAIPLSERLCLQKPSSGCLRTPPPRLSVHPGFSGALSGASACLDASSEA